MVANRTYKSEFKEGRFDEDSIDKLLNAGWRDTSWHNDAYPSFELGDEDGNAMGSFRIWVCDLDPGQREVEEHRQFALCVNKQGEWQEVAEDDDLQMIFCVLLRLFISPRVGEQMKALRDDIKAVSVTSPGIICWETETATIAATPGCNGIRGLPIEVFDWEGKTIKTDFIDWLPTGHSIAFDLALYLSIVSQWIEHYA